MKVTFIPAILTASLAGFLPAPSRAESVIVQWEKIYNGPGDLDDAPRDLAVDSAGNVIVTGGSQGDYYTAKYAAGDGALLWDYRYNSPFNNSDGATGVAVDSAGDVIVTGVSTGSSGLFDIYTAKYAAAHGALLWEKRYNGPANRSDSGDSVAVDRAGNVLITGYTTTELGVYKIYTAKYAAANGALLWEKRYNGLDNNNREAGYFVKVDGAGNVIIAGVSRGTRGTRDVYTAKYAGANGALLWEVRYHGPGSGDEFLRALKLDGEGNAIISSDSPGSSVSSNIYTAKYAAVNGALVWEVRHDDDRSSMDMELDSEGNVIVVGWDNYTAKYAAADGALLWEKHYDAVTGTTVALDSSANVIVSGYTHNGADHDIYTAKYAAADGSLLWEMRYNGTGNLNDFGRVVRADEEGNVIVTARTNYSSVGSSTDIYTVKYAPVDLDLDDDGLVDSWEIAHFGSTAGQSALDDTDSDGAVELLELAFGTDPKSPTAVAGPAFVIEGGYLTTTIAKQPGVTYLVQTSATPGAGFSAASTTVLPGSTTMLKVRDNVLIGTQPARFLRVQVTAAP